MVPSAVAVRHRKRCIVSSEVTSEKSPTAAGSESGEIVRMNFVADERAQTGKVSRTASPA